MKVFDKKKNDGINLDQLTEEELLEMGDLHIEGRLEESKKFVKLRQFLRSPRDSFYQYPEYAFIFSTPAALLFFIIGFHATKGTILIDDVVIFTALILITPPAITFSRKRKRIDRIEESLPNFLRDLAEMSRAGLTLPAAVNTVTRGEYGALTEEIQRMDASLSWGISFETTLDKFAERMNTPLISRTVALIKEADSAGGRITFVLEAAAREANEIKTLQRERISNMMVYIVIIYMSFLVFIFVVLMLSSKFIPPMAEAGQAAAAAGVGSRFIGAFDPENFKRLLFHASVIQGFVAGLVAGQMGEGQISTGLRHSIILTLVAWAAFTFLI
ncbi:type II secretion system F family protein [Methanohalophilus sp.]|uniref:type II secretion system F family protein n=1 Tax=Methanohalophilus sp. TaxID=1966352 RepID=UPI002635B013|nr:type II secretion system F family protein [Methanohalophilus sp.]MDK2892219.1 archaeal flagellar protein FlaJ [Methanohalophilus sp.]